MDDGWHVLLNLAEEGPVLVLNLCLKGKGDDSPGHAAPSVLASLHCNGLVARNDQRGIPALDDSIVLVLALNDHCFTWSPAKRTFENSASARWHPCMIAEHHLRGFSRIRVEQRQKVASLRLAPSLKETFSRVIGMQAPRKGASQANEGGVCANRDGWILHDR